MRHQTAMAYTEDEKTLVKRCLKRERKAQKELYDRYSPVMYVIALRYAKSDLEAEDILQEAFIKIFDHLNDFKGISSLGAWIKRIVINSALNSQRSKLYMYPMTPVETLEHKEDTGDLLANFRLEELINMVHELPDGCRVIFNLYAIEGYNHNEIGKMLNISPGTSKSQYARARMILKDKIARFDRINYERA